MVPFIFNLTDKKILVAGGGAEAESLLVSFLGHDPKIKVISPACTENIKLFHRFGRIEFEQRWAEESDVDSSYYFVFAVTGDSEVDAETAAWARKAHVPVFVQNNSLLSDFVLERGEEGETSDFDKIKELLKTRRG
ncbi:NAD(P)-dependent oxidoreductase [Geovibrio thiophilus]|uniref:precorrin-2 dehydrogenase n=1 Tax=Geovibrio thiophilus TaxID=139438 RepID=A0A410K0I5_9BACT|nr:NAD(P)-dependent oxidoreductase [Geovibrio thiophilus]QAR33947.1 NAD(P)-dependent oxidoreductase [Geovibrio thiophilus]